MATNTVTTTSVLVESMGDTEQSAAQRLFNKGHTRGKAAHTDDPEDLLIGEVPNTIAWAIDDWIEAHTGTAPNGVHGQGLRETLHIAYECGVRKGVEQGDDLGPSDVSDHLPFIGS